MHTLTRKRKQNGIQLERTYAIKKSRNARQIRWDFLFFFFILSVSRTIQESIQFRCSMAGRCWFELLFLAFGLNQTDETRWVNEKSQHNGVVSFIERVFV